MDSSTTRDLQLIVSAIFELPISHLFLDLGKGFLDPIQTEVSIDLCEGGIVETLSENHQSLAFDSAHESPQHLGEEMKEGVVGQNAVDPICYDNITFFV